MYYNLGVRVCYKGVHILGPILKSINVYRLGRTYNISLDSLKNSYPSETIFNCVRRDLMRNL